VLVVVLVEHRGLIRQPQLTAVELLELPEILEPRTLAVAVAELLVLSRLVGTVVQVLSSFAYRQVSQSHLALLTL